MCILYMRVQCSDTYSKLLAGDAEQTELTVESIVGEALLEVFDTVHVQSVLVQQSPDRIAENLIQQSISMKMFD